MSCMKSEAARKLLRLIGLCDGITFEELNCEINKLFAVSCWCTLHSLRNSGFVARDIDSHGHITFSLTERGKELSAELTTMTETYIGEKA